MADMQRAAVRVAGTAVTLVGGGLVVAVPTAHATSVNAGTFAALNTAIKNANTNSGADTITLTANITFPDTGQGGLYGISDDLTIVGGGFTIDAANAYRIFYVNSNVDLVTISDVTLKNGAYGNKGAAIYADGTSLTITNVTFSDNYTGEYGGALQWSANYDSDDLTITNSTFDGNFTVEQGGAIYAAPYGGTVSITNTTFDSNTTGSDGGGAVRISGSGTVTITDSTFTSNVANEYGGALYVEGDELDVTIDNTTFDSNEAHGGGGAIEAYELGSLTITDSDFTNNSAVGGGGALNVDYVYDGTKITGSTFYNNYAGGSGGAIYAMGTNDTYAISLTIDSTEFTMNESMGYGGAIEAYELDELTITSSSFTDNTAYGAGGAIYGEYVYLGITISDTTFDGNTARNGNSGALRSGHDLTITGSTFTDNSSNQFGGAIYAEGTNYTVYISDTTFTGNTAVYSGGAIEAYELGTLVISGSTFDSNTAGYAGGALVGDYIYDEFIITDSVFTNNSAETQYGGAISTDSSLSITGSTFDGNSAGTDGGALYVSDGNLYIASSTFSNNTADGDAGAISLGTAYDVTIVQSTLADNISNAGYGGAIAQWSDSNLVISNSTIAGNGADAAGGGIFLRYDMTLSNTIVSDNRADGADNDIEGTASVSAGTRTVDGDNNLVKVHTVTLSGDGNIEGESAALGALGDNGGTTETMVPGVGSPAIDAGDDTVKPFDTDQRGATRVQGDAIDIGAVETTPVPPTPPVLPATGSGTERAAWLAALLSGVGALTVGASRRRQRS